MGTISIVIRVGGRVPKALALPVATALAPPVPTTLAKPYWIVWENSDSEGSPAEVKFTTVEPGISGLQGLDSIGTTRNVAEQQPETGDAPITKVANPRLEMLLTQSQALAIVAQALAAQVETLHKQLESMM